MGVTEREFERLARKAGKNIQGLRKATGWTQAELEQRSQVVWEHLRGESRESPASGTVSSVESDFEYL